MVINEYFVRFLKACTKKWAYYARKQAGDFLTFPMKGDILNTESQFYDMFFARVTYFYCF